MKILAIRGKNLASLSSEFCVDFQAEPLRSAGLFAISGATGSGKSTLLDALCLALYEKTPRLIKAAGSLPDVGDNKIGSNDPRTILRRGTGEGFAEVDFMGSDEMSYRARWSARRARVRADGTLQGSEISLVRLNDGQILSDHRKTETLKLIETIIGLNFEQFTRAVLLAQNDFAAFLKASDNERAELLQTLTGTDTFARISVQCFGRSRAESDELKRLGLRQAEQPPMAGDVRLEKIGDLTKQEGIAKVLDGTKGTIEGYLRWYQQLEKLKANESDSAVKRDQAKSGKEQAAVRYRQLDRIEAVQPAGPLCAEVDRLQGEMGTGAKSLKESEGLSVQAATLALEQTQLLATLTQQLQSAETARLAAQPVIDQAKAIDAQISTLTPIYQAAVKACEEARLRLDQEQDNQAKLQQGLTQAKTDLGSGERWLDENTLLRPLAEGWLRWETVFEQASIHLRARQTATEEIASLLKTETALANGLAESKSDFTQRENKHKETVAALVKRNTALASFQPEEDARRKQMLEARRDHLASAAIIWKDLYDGQVRLQHLNAQEQAHSAKLTTVNGELGRLSAERPAAQQAQANAEKALSIAELAASENIEQLRTLLDSEQPCPVCGSTTHPYAEQNPQLDRVLAGLREDVEAKRKVLTGILEGIAAAETERAGVQRLVDQLAIDIPIASTALQKSRVEWAEHPLSDEVSRVLETERGVWLAEQQGMQKDALKQLATEETRYREALRLRDAAQLEVTSAQSVLETVKAKVSELILDHQKTAQSLLAERDKLAGLERQLKKVLDDVDVAFSGTAWRDAWLADPVAFVANCKINVGNWNARQKLQGDLSGRISELNATLKSVGEACEKAGKHLSLQNEQCARSKAELETKKANRLKLFDGKLVADIETELNLAVGKLKETSNLQHVSSQKADAERTRLEEAVRQLGGQLATNQKSLEAARQKLNEWLQSFNAGKEGDARLSGEDLKTCLAFDLQWIAGERQALLALDNAITTADAVFSEHRNARAAHEASRPTEESTDALQEGLAKISTELEAANSLLTEIRLAIARDDDRRLLSGELLSQIAKQEVITRTWSQLNELIGSADGKKFRNFAQQLTLDILLGYANRHLEHLSRRYRLKRISDTLGLLVVDQDMGDEIRSVHSLSGGESFLVSLALALGLASLSSHRVQVESLFIDEGFGSLDAESLTVAMEALDNLQAQGRKVGVISHVQEITERIGTQIRVKRLAGGQSRVVVSG